MGKKILVVDDEETVRDLLSDTFQRAGFTVCKAADAKTALEILRTESFPIIFTDLMMPGMNGMELCRAIRQMNPISLIHAVTGLPKMFEIAACRAAGFDDVGMDIAMHRGRALVLEANMKYGTQGLAAAGVDYMRLMERLIRDGTI